ncbi:MAG: hypothetical protein CL816_01585 [Coxiellaceae bacterium]|nr:hypothetical protein [Coxiellaceae bacterium]|tara:strand:+ start:308 stop:991 length:684 start_codon:yes stop_codon:yes gene_type:complete
MSYQSTKIIELGSCAFRQPQADSHCKFIHGYRLKAKFWFEASHLDQNNWVVDFGGLKELKKLMQDQFDHTTCIARTDPKVMLFKQMRDAGVCDLRIMDGVGIEKFAEWCHTTADNFVGVLTEMRCRCVKVEVFEHENNSAIFETRDSSTSGAQYMNDKADEIERSMQNNEPVVDHHFIKDEPTEKLVKPVVDNVTQPPFAKKAKQGLWPEKQKNTWLDKSGKSTWGF